MINDSEYIDVLTQIVQGAIAAGQPYITAAALGETLRRAVSDQYWKDFGYKTLGELLRSPKVDKRLELFKTEKGAIAVRPKPGSQSLDAPALKEYNKLKKAVWGAFVMATPAGRRFLNRKTGAVRSGLQAPPAPYDEWAEITPISSETQKAWASRFLEDVKVTVDDDIRHALGSDQANWVHSFTVAVRNHASDWNRFRSSKVAANVDSWASQCGIPRDLVFQSQTPPNTTIRPGSSVDPADSDRAIILAALATLPIDRLREISLPAGVLLDALRNH